ncbi:MAG: hypothetical protein EB127_24245 [Alphaproteobacteria bacterium]|nr:hypothetical protein [Alphaproteobacteria bacterium]
MYSFDNTNTDYKYESIQHGYEIEYYDEEPIEISLDEMLELENEELELEDYAMEEVSCISATDKSTK